jgi:hypothetical protein
MYVSDLIALVFVDEMLYIKHEKPKYSPTNIVLMGNIYIDPKKVAKERAKKNIKILRYLKSQGLSILEDVDILGNPNLPHAQIFHQSNQDFFE